MSLYNELRPKTFKEVVGQEQAVKTLTSLLKNGFPHTTLIHGPSGTGKTTLARIVADKLGCRSQLDLAEENCAAISNPSDKVREWIHTAGSSPNDGSDCRIWILDEFQSLSRAGFAQQSLLKLLEEPPQTAYFILCTTDPDKIIPTIRNRCTKIGLKSLPREKLEKLVLSATRGKVNGIEQIVVDKIIEYAEGSPRQALVLLEQVIGLPPADQLDALGKADTDTKTADLCNALVKGDNWKTVSRLLRGLDEDVEQLRRMVLSWATTTVLGGGRFAERAAAVIAEFQFDWYACGKAGLVAACYRLCSRK